MCGIEGGARGASEQELHTHIEINEIVVPQSDLEVLERRVVTCKYSFNTRRVVRDYLLKRKMDYYAYLKYLGQWKDYWSGNSNLWNN